MSEQQLFSYTFTWLCTMDERSCPKCMLLNGRQYRDQDLFAAELVDPEFGPVWDLNANRSLAHGGAETCRCKLDIRVEKVHFETLNGFASIDSLLEKVL